MFKLITLLKKRDGLTTEAFRAHYETTHALIGVKCLRGFATKYIRRYIEPLDHNPVTAGYDVIMEIWFADRSQYDLAMQKISEPEMMAEIVADEEKLFDRSATVTFTVVEQSSHL